MIRHAACLLATLALCACSTLGTSSVDDAGEVPKAVALAREDLAAGRTEQALERMRDARELEGLSIEARDEVELLLERSAEQRISELSRADADPADLAQLLDYDLPQQLSVAAGLAAARGFAAQDEPYEAFRTLRDLETKFPLHHGRAEAGAILIDVGLRLARSGGGFWVWTDRADSFAVLEFLVLTYPGEKRCDEAFFELATMYEQDEEYAMAIQRHEELLLAHVESPLSSASQARIPHLRMIAIDSPDYDRRELLRARRELEDWLAKHAGHELEREVQLDYADCLQRLVQSDLGIASFYRRIDRPFGARYHAARALETARVSTSPTLIARADAFLAGLPQVSELPGEQRTPSDSQFSHDSTELREALERQRPQTERPKDAQP
ncbi:MAG: hypothetical protein IT454_07005 [Planctomycetes bacterium]|nr:hypothetical protein [Planctomycetota bacterium]